MGRDLEGFKVAMVGGDAREKHVIQHLLRQNLTLCILGLPQEYAQGAVYAKSIYEALGNADVLILPMPGINSHGQVHAPLVEEKVVLSLESLKLMKPGSTVYTGIEKPHLKTLVNSAGHRLVEVAEQDEFAILNSIPSAEGAIAIALQQSAITLHRSNCVILGFGRLGITLARMLLALGAKVQVVARNGAQRSRAWEMGCSTKDFDQLKLVLEDADFIFNTVPFQLIQKQELTVIRPTETLIIDLASEPGGVDLELAKKYGIKAIFAPGLPGKVAPKTAGHILGVVYSRLIKDLLEKGSLAQQLGGVVE